MKIFLSDEAQRAGLVVKLPRPLDAGFDLPCLEPVTVKSQDMALIRTGVHVSIPVGWVGLVRDRSSVALRGGVTSAGVIDSSYRGEIKVVMHNLGSDDLVFGTGDRIAQCLVLPHFDSSSAVLVSSLEDLGDTERGDGGFGSTGR